MKISIYPKGSSTPNYYEVDFAEFQRLSNDWQQFIKDGSPRSGMYSYYTDVDRREKKDLFLDFHKISIIG